MAAESRRQALQAGLRFVEADLVERSCTNLQDSGPTMPDMGAMIYDTKTALILRRDLAAWQVANVAAFLAGGLAGTHGHLMGEPYRDGGGRAYTGADPRAGVRLWRHARGAAPHPPAGAVARAGAGDLHRADVQDHQRRRQPRRRWPPPRPTRWISVGIGVHGPRKTIDKVVNGLQVPGAGAAARDDTMTSRLAERQE